MKDIKDDTYLILPSEDGAVGEDADRLLSIPDLCRKGALHGEDNSETGVLVYDDGARRAVIPERDNKNSIILGRTGCNKSTGAAYALARNAIAQGHSIIMSDPKGEMRAYLGCDLEAAGFKILVFDPRDPEASDSLNMVRYISDLYHSGEEDLACKLIDNIISVLIPADREPRERSWNDASQKVASAEMLTVVKYGRCDSSFLSVENLHRDVFGDTGNMPDDILSDFKRDQEIFGRISYAVTNANSTRGSIVAPIGGGLAAMTNTEGKRKVFNSTTTDFDLGSPLAVFVRSDKEVGVSSTTVVIEFFRTLIEHDNHGRTFFFNIDESGNYLLPSLPGLFSLMRGYGCYVNIVLQSLAQLGQYFENARTIIENTHVWYVYSCEDPQVVRTLVLKSPIGPGGHVVDQSVISEIPLVRGRLLILTDGFAGLSWFRPSYERGLDPYVHVPEPRGEVVEGSDFLQVFSMFDLDHLLAKSAEG